MDTKLSPAKPWYQNSSPLGDAFAEFHDRVSTQSSLEPKTMELIKIAVSSVLRCQHCTQSHIHQAKLLGISQREITDALMMSALQAAGTQLYWDLAGFQRAIGSQDLSSKNA